MVTLAVLALCPALAALAAFVLMERPWWWGAAICVGLAVVGLIAPLVFYAVILVGVGWCAALIGTAILIDDSVVAAAVYFTVSTLMILIWLLAGEGTF